MPLVTIEYFAKLRDERGLASETRQTPAATPAALYEALQTEFGFSLDPVHLRVAVNLDFARWDQALRDGDTVVFIPPVAGG